MLSRTVKRDVKVTRPLVVMLGRAVDRGRAVTRAEATPGTRKEGKEYASTRSSCEPCSITTRWKQTVLHPPPPPLLRAVTFRCAETSVTVIIQPVFENRPRPHRFLPRTSRYEIVVHSISMMNTIESGRYLSSFLSKTASRLRPPSSSSSSVVVHEPLLIKLSYNSRAASLPARKRGARNYGSSEPRGIEFQPPNSSACCRAPLMRTVH